MNIFSSFSRAGLICSYRAIDVRIKSVEPLLRRIEIDKNSFNGPKKIKASFTVDLYAVISTKDNQLLSLADINIKERVILDFIVNEGRFQLVKGITVLR